MMADPCREMRPLIGVAALGGLDPAEEIALHAHLDGCAACRAELRDLVAVARALPAADPGLITEQVATPPRLADQVTDRIAFERARRRHTRFGRLALAGAAALATAAAIVGLLLVVGGSTTGGTKVSFPTAHGVSGHATLHAQSAGTEVAFHVAGLHDGDAYWLWLTGADGKRVAAGTFRGGSDSMDLTMNAAIPLREARRIWVTDADDDVVLDAQLPA
jgi:predicted anti-sigma-YlaC factor YlaD